MNALRLDIYWLLLSLGTALTWAIGDRGGAGTTAVLVILAIAALKGVWIAREFMALRRINFMWPALVIGWLLAVLAMIAATYWKGSA